MEKPTESYTVRRFASHETAPVKGSRFIGLVYPFHQPDTLQKVLTDVRIAFPAANHYCWAYRLWQQEAVRFSDDNEPAGSAGKPILAPITGQNLFDTLIIVVRYFGGTKLGVGGLVRAYGQAASAVLAEADIIALKQMSEFRIVFDYEDTAAVEKSLYALNLTPLERQYGSKVQMKLVVEEKDVQFSQNLLTENTAGRIQFL